MKRRLMLFVFLFLFAEMLEAHPLYDQVKSDLDQNQYFQVSRVLQDYQTRTPQDAYVQQFSDFFSGLQQLDQLFAQRFYDQAFQQYNDMFQKNYPPELVEILRSKSKYVVMHDTLAEIAQYSKAGDLDYLAGLYQKAAGLNPKDTQWQQDADFYKELADLAFKAKALFRQSSFQESFEIFNQITQKLTEHEEMLTYRNTAQEMATAKDLYMKGVYEDTLDTIDRCVRRLPREEFLMTWRQNANALLKLKKQAQALMEKQDYDGSKMAYAQILKVNAADANAQARIKDLDAIKTNVLEGTQFLIQGKYSLALLYLNKAYQIQPSSKDLQQRISVCHRIMFYQSEGRESFKPEALAKFKTYPELYGRVVQEILQEKQKKFSSDPD